MNMSKTKKSGNGVTRNRVPNDVFVKAWAKASTMADVLESTGISSSGAFQKAKRLREAGVKLPKLGRAERQPIDVSALNALLK